MIEYEVICETEAYSSYSQVALFDAACKDSYPKWKTGWESMVFGTKGVAVATASDQKIRISICRGEGMPEHFLSVSGEICIGDQGIEVGNVAASTLVNIPIETGRYIVTVYTNGIRNNVTTVFFFLTPVG
jgi:hypothetical protein